MTVNNSNLDCLRKLYVNAPIKIISNGFEKICSSYGHRYAQNLIWKNN